MTSSDRYDPVVRLGDARRMDDVPDESVALVVTSPPYAVGKDYELDLTYNDLLDLLRATLAELERVVEVGGRVAINTSNIGRQPFRPMTADVLAMLRDTGWLLRGEIVWLKPGHVAAGCAWGSWRSAANPTLRSTQERIAVASKGQLARHPSITERARLGLPHRSTITADDFVEATREVWSIQTDSTRKRRFGHPAPFPMELPRRLIELYSFAGDVVLDPFAGSGTTLMAAWQTGRRGIGYDIDTEYVDLARRRVAAASQQQVLV